MKGIFNQNDTSVSFEVCPKDLDSITKLIQKIVPDFVQEGMMMLTQNFQYWRMSNAISLIGKMQKKIQDSGLQDKDLKKISPKLFHVILEKGSLEENQSLQAKRANLLFGATTHVSSEQIYNSYAEILGQLGAIEVAVLDELFLVAANSVRNNKDQLYTDVLFSTERIAERFSKCLHDTTILVENFFRLRLAEPPIFSGMTTGDGLHPILKTNTRFHLTDLGVAFISACKG